MTEVDPKSWGEAIAALLSVYKWPLFITAWLIVVCRWPPWRALRRAPKKEE